MPSASYPFAVGRIRVLEQALLGSERLKQLSGVSRKDFAEELNDLGFAAECPVRDSVDALIAWRERQVRDIIEEVTPVPAMTELFFLDIDAANIKLLIKSRITGEDCSEYLGRGVFAADMLKKCVEQRNYSSLGQPLGELLNLADNDSFEPSRLSSAVDHAFYSEIFARLAKHKNKFLQGYFTLKVDCTNVTSALRAKKLGYSEARFEREFMPGGSVSKKDLLTLLNSETADAIQLDTVSRELIDAVNSDNAEARVQQLLTGYAASEAHDPFGVGPIVNYAVSALDECRRLRVLYAEARRVTV